MNENEIKKLKKGDKLIFHRDGGLLSAQKGNVFTFSKWHDDNGRSSPYKYFWQCVELIESGNTEHNFSIFDAERFDEKIHKEHNIMTLEKLRAQHRDFVEKFGI